MASGVGSAAVDAASGVVDGVGSALVSGDVDADADAEAEFESVESSEVSEESAGWAESVSEAHPAAINIETKTERLALLLMTNSKVHGDLNSFYLCVA